MAIPIPITRTKIATQPWGIPITNEVNRLTTQSDSNKLRLDALEPKVATTAWINCTLVNGWTHQAGGPLQYRKVGDEVSIRGRVDGAGAAWLPITTLPVGYRAPVEIMIATPVVKASAWVVNALQFTAAGQLIPTEYVSSWAPTFTFSITP
jgi:hypothetical protein